MNLQKWKERGRRQEAAIAKLHIAVTDSEIIEATAEYLIAHRSSAIDLGAAVIVRAGQSTHRTAGLAIRYW
jgi:hypothetical protein